MNERTLIIFKPDAVQRGIVGEILTRFERVGLKILAFKMSSPSREHYHHHYEAIGGMISRRGEKAFDVTLGLMTQGPVIAAVMEGCSAVALVRKMVGETEPRAASPGTVRGDYAHMSFGYADKAGIGIPNILHASGDQAEAALEIAHWFSEGELFSDYQTCAQKFM